MKNVEELDLYKEYKFAYDKAVELEFFEKQQEADYYYEYAMQLKKKIDNGETILYKVNFWERDKMTLEDLYWWRVQRLWTMYNSITNDEVYKAMWERKLKELLLRGFRGEWITRLLQYKKTKRRKTRFS